MKKPLTKPWITSVFYSIETFIALLTLICIFIYIFLHFVWHAPEWYQLLPLYVALTLGGIPIVFNLGRKLIHKQFSSDLLAGISIVTAVFLEQYVAGTLVVLMLSGGQALELYAIRRASSLLEALSNRMPNIAHRKQDNIVMDVVASAIEIDHVLVVYPHEICPVDGVVLEGRGVMDESYLTGEPFVISKTPGSNVLSGSINGDTMLVMQATKKAIDSRYAKIMQVMVDSEQRKPSLRRLGDWLGAFYTPIALLIAIAAWIISGDPMRFLAVLVIATPCPLLIAIPVTIIGAISLSAKHGIIIKNPAILEQIDRCRTIIFDKTGTLTYGKPNLTEVTCFRQLSQNEALFSQNEALSLAASLEKYSKHPLSGAIIEAAKKYHLFLEEVTQISEKPGDGLVGIVRGKRIVITGRNQLEREGKHEWVERLPKACGLECVMLVDGELTAHFRFHDTPRSDSRSFIRHLAPMHHFDKVMIVSGDREEEVRYLAEEIGIREIHAGKTPEEKVRIVEEEVSKAKTIYLGDGINDAPALTVATVGIAFGQNSDITAEAADAVIMENTLEKVDQLFHISRRMRRIALQSALGGMALSVAGMILAALGYLSPVVGAISQEVIDVFAVLNALRMTFLKEKLTDY